MVMGVSGGNSGKNSVYTEGAEAVEGSYNTLIPSSGIWRCIEVEED